MSTAASSTTTGSVSGGPNIELVYEAMEQNRLRAIRSSAQRLFEIMEQDDPIGSVWSFADSVWPARWLSEYESQSTKDTTLTLMPLSRIGQMEGKSGSLVLISYFADKGAPNIPRSHPIVIKTMPASDSKLHDEYKNALAVKPFAYDQKDVFAIPFLFDAEDPDFHVLWSILSASARSWYTDEPSIMVKDLREPIRNNDEKKVKEVLDSALSSLSTFHRPFGRQIDEERDIHNEYEWYLRKFNTVWGAEWSEVWAKADQKLCSPDGKELINPLWILERLRGKSIPMTVGAIHGDLHPGNIVLSHDKSSHIIDFGWSQHSSHIAKDFVLLECNLRFLLLRPQLSTSESRLFSRWLKWEEDIPIGLSSSCISHANMILHLRSLATKAFPDNTDWNWQYLVPMFFVAFGLLRFAPQVGNQVAAVETVLGLAECIADFVDA